MFKIPCLSATRHCLLSKLLSQVMFDISFTDINNLRFKSFGHKFISFPAITVSPTYSAMTSYLNNIFLFLPSIMVIAAILDTLGGGVGTADGDAVDTAGTFCVSKLREPSEKNVTKSEKNPQLG